MFFWKMTIVTMCFVLTQYVVSLIEGGNSTRLPFLKHGGNWGDLLLLSFVNGLIANHAFKYLYSTPQTAMVIVIASCIASLVMHWIWFKTQNITSWMWVNPENGWFGGLSTAGGMHLVLMWFEIMVLTSYALATPMPESTIYSVAWLLTIFFPLAILGPCWVINHKVIDLQGGVALIATLILTWDISLVKVICLSR